MRFGSICLAVGLSLGCRPTDGDTSPRGARSGGDWEASRPPGEIEGAAMLPRPRILEAAGPVAAIEAGDATDTYRTWTITVEGAEAPLELQLPPAVELPLALGDTVTLRASVYGGGPNVMGTLLLLDAQGHLLVAIDALPDGWGARDGPKLRVRDHAKSRLVMHGLVVVAPSGEVELDGAWRTVTVEGRPYWAYGTTSENTWRGRELPPDFVSDWWSVAVVRKVEAQPSASAQHL